MYNSGMRGFRMKLSATLRAARAAFAASAAAAAALCARAQGFDDPFAESIDPWYAGAEALAVLPGGGNRLEPSFAPSAFAGIQLDDAWAVEASCLCAPNATSSSRQGGSALWGAGARALWYFGGDLIGYERFAPCLTLGVDAFGSRGGDFPGGHRVAAGPSAGLLFYWHATERVSLRAGARMSFIVDSQVQTVAAAGAGIVYSWGGSDSGDATWRLDP